MNHEQLPIFEIGHFEASIPEMLTGSLKYIVSRTQEDMHFILHADATEGLHIGVAKKAHVDSSSVLGGGYVAWGGNEFTLRGSSMRFKEEPPDIRSAFIHLINERFHDDLEKFIQSRTAQKEV